jgi:aryl-alcohol dehydrogenase-like predicted oxidoreductase
MNRREMIKKTVAGSGLVALSAIDARTRAAEKSSDWKVPQRTLGRTGEEVSMLGIGCAQMGNNNETTPEDIEKVFRRALELGVNYLDTAPNYSRAEEKMGPAIKKIRDQVFLVTKTEEPTYEGTWRLLRQSMDRLQTDHIDLVHIHNVGFEERFPDLDLTLGEKGTLGALREAKEKGVIRYIGASGHLYPSRFHRVLDTGEIDVIMNAVNFVAQHVYDFEHKVWSRARQENIGLVAMKVLGGGGQGDTPYKMPAEAYEKAIRYAISLPGLSTAVIGLENVEELEQAARTVTFSQPLSEEESAALYSEGFEMAQTERWRRPYGIPVT